MYLFGTNEYIDYAVHTYSSSMLRAAFSVLHSSADAEDAVQEAFIRLMTACPQFHDSEHEKAWLLRVTINIARNMRRSQSRRERQADIEIPCHQEIGRELLEAVLALPEKYSTVVHLYYYEGYSIKEIARILNLPPATVGTRIARGRNALRNAMKGEADYE